MSNMGYFQLKALPGLWQLGVAPGRSQELYGIAAAGQEGAGQGGALKDSLTTYIDSFSGRHLSLRVRKRPGKENEKLLPDAATDADAAAPAGGKAATPSSSAAAAKRKDDVINVFTVASGHMYERLQKIMFLSVIKNTKSR